MPEQSNQTETQKFLDSLDQQDLDFSHKFRELKKYAEQQEKEIQQLRSNVVAWRIGYNSALEQCKSKNPDVYKLGAMIAIRNLMEGTNLGFIEFLPEPYDTIP